PSYNAAVGGARWSRHTYGDGVDIAAPDQISKNVITSSCKRLGAGFTLVYATHVHCDWRSTPQATELNDEHAHSTSEIEIMEVEHEQQIENAKAADELVQAHLGIQAKVIPAVKASAIDDTVSRAASKRESVVLSASYLDIEGEGVPDLQWTVTAQNGKSLDLMGQDVVFEAKRGATYQVQLLMGGHYRMTQSVHVPRQ
ncbi:MAG: hypothetical protein K2X47_01240, partial [Bdellovibrionales bacterium]|nr:hypothetical protein [Bdellovibrionales bacterium]